MYFLAKEGTTKRYRKLNLRTRTFANLANANRVMVLVLRLAREKFPHESSTRKFFRGMSSARFVKCIRYTYYVYGCCGTENYM